MEVPERRIVREQMVEQGPAPVPVEPLVATDPAPVPAYNYRAVQVVWFLTGLVDAMIGIRFVMKLLGASLSSPFTTFMYGVTEPLVAPFRGIFGATAQSGYVFEPASLVAIVIYALIGWGLVSLIRIATAPRTRRPLA